jgi:hypothetical protein
MKLSAMTATRMKVKPKILMLTLLKILWGTVRDDDLPDTLAK